MTPCCPRMRWFGLWCLFLMQGEQFFEECRRGRGTLRRRLAGAGPASGDVTRDWLGVGRTWEAAVEAAEEGQTWIVRDVTAEASLEERLSIVSSCSPVSVTQKCVALSPLVSTSC